MPSFSTNSSSIELEANETMNKEIKELNELQLAFVGGGNVIVTLG
jgi:hypothetical protein